MGGLGQYWSGFGLGHVVCCCECMVCPKSNENDLKKKLLNIHAITVYPLQNRLLVIEYSDSSIAAILHSSEMLFKSLVTAAWKFSTVPKWCPLRWVLSLGNRKKSHGAKSGCTVGGEVLWYYFEPKIPSQQLMYDLAHCHVEGTTCLQFHGERAQLCFSNAEYL